MAMAGLGSVTYLTPQFAGHLSLTIWPLAFSDKNRRHRLGVAVAGAAVLLLVGFAVVQAVQLRRITRERGADRITQVHDGYV